MAQLRNSQPRLGETESPPRNDTDLKYKPADNHPMQSPSGLTHDPSFKQGHQKLVFTDPVAFQYLQEDPSTIVLDRRRTLQGYEIYIVEQWACSRIHPTSVINTYTGDASHSAVVSVLSVPTDENSWSPRLKVYFDAMSRFHARKRDTPLGILMVTNLSSFPSALTVIAVPDGDVKTHREDFVVNEDLKRLGCSGRAGLNLTRPTAATETKFHQLYRTSERVPLYNAVTELVKLCQIALTVFNKLAPEYVDGLLCDVTERAINDWWTDIGTDFFNIEPSDGILGPTTVSALLGLLMGTRNRLSAFGAPVAKDAFDLPYLKRGIGSFQKSQRLDKTRRLDRQTLDRLQRVTAKAASGDGWAVPRAVKSTVAEFGGKGGEMVMGIVGGRDKAGISEVETLDMDRFVQLASGERAKWLWHGKPRKTGSDLFRQGSDDGEMIFVPDEHGGYHWTSKKRDTASNYTSVRPSLDIEQSPRPLETPEDREQQLKLALKKSVSGKVSDARAGFDKFREAVGLPGIRSHYHKRSREAVDLEDELHYQQSNDSDTNLLSPKEHTSMGHLLEEESSWKHDARKSASLERHDKVTSGNFDPNIGTSNADPKLVINSSTDKHTDRSNVQDQPIEIPSVEDRQQRSRSEDILSQTKGFSKRRSNHLRRTGSLPTLSTRSLPWQNERRWPRHLSFSAVEDTILLWDSIATFRKMNTEQTGASPDEAMFYEDICMSDTAIFSDKIKSLSQSTASWVENKVAAVESIDHRALARLEDLNSAYQGKLEDYHSLRMTSLETLEKKGSSLMERSKRVELLGAKLDYDLNTLQSRVEEVEGGLDEYERHIQELERRVESLVKDEKGNNSTSWFQLGNWIFGRRS